jgi:hypothetical protein
MSFHWESRVGDGYCLARRRRMKDLLTVLAVTSAPVTRSRHSNLCQTGYFHLGPTARVRGSDDISP